MEHPISATELARTLGDVLARIRYRGESFVVERNGRPIARLLPIEAATARATLQDALTAWCQAPADAAFADDLARIGAADRPPANPWAS
jgi:prevent-host-death family protein